MKNCAIFLLERDDLVRTAFLDILQEEGYEVYPFEDAWQAVSFVKKVNFQIGILESGFKDFNLGDLISEINKIKPRPSIIVTTLKPEIEEIISFYNYGVEMVLIKPINIAELMQGLKKAENCYQERLECERLREKIRGIEEEKKAVEESLKKAGKYLPLAELSRSLAHELKNALTAINLSLHYIKKNISLSDAKLRKHFELLDDSISSANNFTMKLLGIVKEKKESVNFNKFIDDTLEILELELKNNGIRVLKSYQEDLPELSLDSNALRQVLINIILNARESMTGGGQLGVKTYLEDKDKLYIVIEVTDTGAGIAPDYIDKIFIPSYSTKEKGTGLGLYISKKIIEDMQGKIEVNSILGKGSRFKIMLPCLDRENIGIGQKHEGK